MIRRSPEAAKYVLALATLLGAALLAAPALTANITRVRALQSVDVRASIQDRAANAWQSGWAGVCTAEALANDDRASVDSRLLPFVAMNAIEQGDYGAALRLFRQLEAEGGDLGIEATAYRAALELDWQTAAERYAPDEFDRHRQFWGTVFYQAAQQRFFAGDGKGAAGWYRRADGLYDTVGPLADLALVDCLERDGRFVEAWDVYRRALATLPQAEALTHRERFNHLRLAGLRQWRQQDPGNQRVQRWLAFFEADDRNEESELLHESPNPMQAVDLDLGGGRKLVGLDYRAEDIETGPFMLVDFYIQGGALRFERLRRVVVNQAVNGSFAWDATPKGVRPAGWPGWVYSAEGGVLSLRTVHPGEIWLCQEDLPSPGGFGSEGATSPIGAKLYVQGGRIWNDDRGSAALGRRWISADPDFSYSYAGYAHPPASERSVAGSWAPPAAADKVAVWLLVSGDGMVCYTDLFLIAVDEL